MPQGRSAGEIQADIEKAMAGVQLPAGYYWDWGTNQKRQAEEFGGMGLAVVLAIALIYMLLASQFESFVHPLTILLSVPLAATGVILALFLTGRSFGLTAFIGVLMLVGIVVKNGILLVDYTNVLRGRGMMREEALLTAGPTRLAPDPDDRLRRHPRHAAARAGLGKGSEVQAPMATAVIGGLATSTFLTLFVVPTVYTLLDDAASFFRRKGGRNDGAMRCSQQAKTVAVNAAKPPAPVLHARHRRSRRWTCPSRRCASAPILQRRPADDVRAQQGARHLAQRDDPDRRPPGTRGTGRARRRARRPPRQVPPAHLPRNGHHASSQGKPGSAGGGSTGPTRRDRTRERDERTRPAHGRDPAPGMRLPHPWREGWVRGILTAAVSSAPKTGK